MKIHGGFGPVNEGDIYRSSVKHSYEGIIQKYHTMGVVAAAEGNEKENMLKVIEDTVKSIQVKGQDICTVDYLVRMKWFQKE